MASTHLDDARGGAQPRGLRAQQQLHERKPVPALLLVIILLLHLVRGEAVEQTIELHTHSDSE